MVNDAIKTAVLPAPTLRTLVNDAIEQHINPDALRLTRMVEQSERDVLTTMVGGAR